jgi:hypothetical protein
MNKLNILSKLGHYANAEWSIKKQITRSHWGVFDKYPCANPEGPVDNSECPEEDPLCNCPCPELKPEMPEEVEYTNVCDAISGHKLFGEEWMGCSWNDLNSPYSCNCPCVGEKYNEFIEYTRTYSTYWDTPKHQPLWREAQMMLLKSSGAVMTMHGDLTIRPGQIIYIINTSGTGEKIKNKKSGGRWLVENISHSIEQGLRHTMTLFLTRDSSIYNPNEFDAPTLEEKPNP